MIDDIIPKDLQRHLEEIGVFTEDLEDDETLNVRAKRPDDDEDDYGIPDLEFDEDGEPNF